MNKRWIVLFVIVAVASIVAGCGGGVQQPTAPVAPVGPYPMTITDNVGRDVVITEEPLRIVSLMPSLTETLFALGLGERVVGVTSYCNYPKEALAIDNVGGLYDLNAEAILALEPDIVLAGKSSTVQEVLDVLEANGVTVVVIDPQSLAEIEDAIREIARLTNVPDRGEQFAAEVHSGRNAVSREFAGVDLDLRPRVFILLDTDYLYTVGAGEFLSEMIEAAGGLNAAFNQGDGWLLLSEEVLFELDPDIIILTHPTQIFANPSWEGLQAIANGRVYTVDGDLVSRPGPRVAQGLTELNAVFYRQ
ncbi:MAG: ABC transporter substrate-binding protein [Clostridiales bacterium]|jgi:iron complex transport system substrate-binding protein|nr:ABC transporter substrate-binding protein [Clostridiales bacterium]